MSTMNRTAKVSRKVPASKQAALTAALERIEVKAQAGLCYFTLGSAREFLKDIRDEVAEALGKEKPQR